MKVVHIITGLCDGGAEGVLFRLCSHDRENRHTVVSLMGEGKYGPILRQAGVEVHCLGMPRGRVTVLGGLRLLRLLRRLRPDLVQTWMYHADLVGGLAARLIGCREVVWGIRQSNLDPEHSPASTVIVAKGCARLSRWIPARIIVCAEKAARIHAALGYATARMVVIPNGYELSLFQPDPAARNALRAQWGIAQQTPLIGMVARLDPQKDHANLLAALGFLKGRGIEPLCVLVGTGMDDDNESLARLIKEAGLEEGVRCLGRRADIPAIMNALDLHVLSSLGEAFPNVLAEAMACGTPCVTTDVGDAALIVGDTGWVVPPRSPQALADAVGNALEARHDTLGWQSRTRAARGRVADRFSMDRMVQAYRRVWTEVATGGE